MFAMTFWTWGQFFKWTGLIYAIYYSILISYEVWKASKKNNGTEGGERIYEIPHFDMAEKPPIKVTLLEMQTIADKWKESDVTEKEAQINMAQTPVGVAFEDSKAFNQAVVEEHSLNTAEFAQTHRQNVGKALNAFS